MSKILSLLSLKPVRYSLLAVLAAATLNFLSLSYIPVQRRQAENAAVNAVRSLLRSNLNGGVYYTVYDRDIGYIRLDNLTNNNVHRDFDQALSNLRNCNSIILDLRRTYVRDNSGNAFENMSYIYSDLADYNGTFANPYVPRYAVDQYHWLDRNGIIIDTYENNGSGYRESKGRYYAQLGNRQLVVLQDNQTVCSAEILVHALQANTYVYCIGTDTYGNAYTPVYMRDRNRNNHNMTELDFYRADNNNRRYLIGSYRTQSQWRAQPHRYVQLNNNARIGDPNSDNQLQEAIYYLRGNNRGPGGPNNGPGGPNRGPGGPNNGPGGPNNGPGGPNNGPGRGGPNDRGRGPGTPPPDGNGPGGYPGYPNDPGRGGYPNGPGRGGYPNNPNDRRGPNQGPRNPQNPQNPQGPHHPQGPQGPGHPHGPNGPHR
jgi:hypothetical protein